MLCWLALLFTSLALGAITETTSFVSSISTKDYYWQAAAVVTSFDQAMFVSLGCGAGNNVALDSCSGGTGTVSSPYCVNSMQSSITVTSTSPSATYWQGTISALDFSGLAITVRNVMGNPTVTWTAGNFSQVIFHDSFAFPVGICLDDLLVIQNGTWDGSWTLLVEASSEASFELHFAQDSSAMPLSTWYSLATTSITCTGVTLEDCSDVYCPYNVPATEDPYYSFYANYYIGQIAKPSVTPLLAEDTMDNTIATIVSIQKIEVPAKVPTVGTGIGAQALDSTGERLLSSCSVSYTNLKTASGAVTVETNSIVPASLDCSSSAFADKEAVWSSIISTLDRAGEENLSTSQTFDYVNWAHVTAASRDWVACRELAASFLEVDRYSVTVPTTDCLTPPGSPEWAFDPCCNTALQLTQCCAGGTYQVMKEDFTYLTSDEFATLNATCEYPYCADVIMVNYETLAGSSEFCTEESDRANADPRFNSNPYLGCFAAVFGKKCFFSSQCTEISGSLCDVRTGTCTVPCGEDGSCYRGNCTADPTFGTRCVVDPSRVNDGLEVIFPTFVNCILGEIDPYLAALIVAEVYDPSSPLSYYQQFSQRLTSNTCVENVTKIVQWLDPDSVSQTTCENSYRWCDWQQCKIPGQCSLAQCENAFPASNYCGFDLGSYLKLMVGNPPVCSVRHSETLKDLVTVDKSPNLCLSLQKTYPGFPTVQHTFVGVPNTNFQPYSSCLADVPDNTTCLLQPQCVNPAAGLGCRSYCNLTAIFGLNTTTCSGPLYFDRPPLNFSLPIPPATLAVVPTVGLGFVCAAFGTPLDVCLGLQAQGRASWAQGYTWKDELYNSPETCNGAGICYDGIDLDYNQSVTAEICEQDFTCTSCIIGNETSCFDEQECLNSFTCDNQPGCFILPVYLNTLPYDVPCVWTPKGCISPLTKSQCDLSNRYRGNVIFWQPRYNNQTKCTTDSYICRLKDTPANISYVGGSKMPDGFDLRNQSECEACGGTYQPFFNWVPGRWIRKRTWLTLSWETKTAVNPVWIPQINPYAFEALLEASRAQRLSSILIGELYCTYGAEKELFASLSCNCGVNQTDCSVGDSTAELTISGMSACSGVPGNITTRWITEDPLIFEVGDNFTITNGDVCVKVTLSTVPLYLLERPETIQLSSLFITSESLEDSSLGQQFVYNTQDPPVVVGQLIGDGIGLSLGIGNFTVENFRMCIHYPANYTWKLRIDPYYKTIVFSDKDLTTFEIQDYNLPLTTTEVCVPVSSDVIVFPSVVIEDWATIELKDAWPSEELGFDIALAVLYGIDWFIITGSLFFNVYLTFVKKEHAKTLGDFLSLLFLFVLCTLRTVYFSGVPSGQWEDSFALVIIFGDLPALLFLASVILTGNKWGQIYYTSRKLGTDDYKKKNRILAAFSFFLISTIFIIFIILSAIYGNEINNIEQLTCRDPPSDGLTYVETISLVYKCIFAFYCLVTALFFGFFGGSFVKLVFDFTQKGEKEARTRKFLLVTTICVCALLALSAILIASTRISFDNMAKFAIILCCEWFPITGLCFLYGLQNFNRKAAKDTTVASHRTRPTGGSSSTR